MKKSCEGAYPTRASCCSVSDVYDGSVDRNSRSLTRRPGHAADASAAIAKRWYPEVRVGEALCGGTREGTSTTSASARDRRAASAASRWP